MYYRNIGIWPSSFNHQTIWWSHSVDNTPLMSPWVSTSIIMSPEFLKNTCPTFFTTSWGFIPVLKVTPHIAAILISVFLFHPVFCLVNLSKSQSPNPEVMTLPHSAPVTAVTFSKDGSHVATASSDGIVRAWIVSCFMPWRKPLMMTYFL